MKSPLIVPAGSVAIAGMLFIWLFVPPTTLALDESCQPQGFRHGPLQTLTVKSSGELS
jgi:hypothetical protein